jgi:hypothetical protein
MRGKGLDDARPRRWGRLVAAVVLLGATMALSPDDALAVQQPLQPTFVQYFKQIGVGGVEVATGDVNGDGNLDLAATSETTGVVSLLLGHGDGTISDAVNYATGDTPVYVTFGDLNGDANDDVIVGGTGGISVLLANGDGTLAAPTLYAPGLGASVTATDVNGDGKVDVLVSNTNGLLLLPGNGDGTLGTATFVPSVSGSTGYIALADVNGDSFMDLLRHDVSGNRIEVLLGDGAGGFTSHAFIPAGPGGGAQSLVVADFNADGHLDVAAIKDYSTGQMLLALGNGDGSFGTPSIFPSGALNPYSVAAGDLNGDGIPDLAIADAFDPARGLLGRGDGTFTTWDPHVGRGISTIMADFNHDGVDDVAYATDIATMGIPDSVGVLVNTTNLQLDRPVATCGDGSATVSWTAPVGAAVVTGYEVTTYIGYWPKSTITFNSTATTQTITGLTNGLDTGFRVDALTAGHSGPMSKASNHVIPSTPTAPAAPTIGSATPGDSAATVSWTAGASEACWPVTGYVVTPYIGYFPLSPTTFNSTATTQTITGLANGTTYRFRVQAINGAGTGPYSKVTNSATPTT